MLMHCDQVMSGTSARDLVSEGRGLLQGMWGEGGPGTSGGSVSRSCPLHRPEAAIMAADALQLVSCTASDCLMDNLNAKMRPPSECYLILCCPNCHELVSLCINLQAIQTARQHGSIFSCWTHTSHTIFLIASSVRGFTVSR